MLVGNRRLEHLQHVVRVPEVGEDLRPAEVGELHQGKEALRAKRTRAQHGTAVASPPERDIRNRARKAMSTMPAASTTNRGAAPMTPVTALAL